MSPRKQGLNLSIQKSLRLSSAQQRGNKDKRANSAFFFRTGRQAPTLWSSRFKHEAFDLNYNVNYSQIKGKNEMLGHNRKGSASAAMRTTQNSFTTKIEHKQKSRISMILMNKQSNPETIPIGGNEGDNLGLSYYEFQNTIAGRMRAKSHKNIEFERQTPRPLNINKVWSREIRKTEQQSQFGKNKQNNRSHPFFSYTERRVFLSKGKLDKFYNTQGGEKLITRSSVKPIKIREPREEKMKLPFSSTLAYNVEEARKKTMSKTCCFSMSKLKKQLVFNRQVISPSKGCYR